MKKENATTHPVREGLEKAKKIIESVISIDGEASDTTVSQWNAEMESAKVELKKKFPTYPELLEAAARAKVMSMQALAPLQMVMGEHFERLIKASDSLPDVNSEDNVTTADISVFMEMLRGSVQTMADIHINKVRREHRLASAVNGAEGAKAKADRYAPLKEKTIEMALAGNYESRNQAAYQIAPKIAQMPEFKNNGMSVQSAKDTVARWLKEAGIEFKKSSGKRSS